VYEVYFLNSGHYDLVGFRFNVQWAFNELVAAIGASGVDLGGLTPPQWVHAEGAHLCAKVLIRRHSEAWPTLGSTPIIERRLAQKNLAPFAVDVAITDSDPVIAWRNFMVGDPIEFLIDASQFDERFGRHTLTLLTELPSRAFRIYLAIPSRSFKRWISTAQLKGFKPIPARDAEKLKPPFPDCAVFLLEGKEGVIEVPVLGREFLAMSLGIQYSVKLLKPDTRGTIAMRHETAIPKIDRSRQYYELSKIVSGGFTFALDVHDSRQIPDWMKRP
jgi:hypothetical protein